MNESHHAIEAVWRIESARLIAGLTRIVGDVGTAEDLAQDALLAALAQWPRDGVPKNPGAWLMQAARHRAIDLVRRGRRLETHHAELGRVADEGNTGEEASILSSLDDPVGDDLLRLVFTCCHPMLSMDARVALTLRLLGGLTTDEIARAFLTTESTIAHRIVRAKKRLAEARVAFEVPRGDALRERLDSVLRVTYLIFNEGYSPTTGSDWLRPGLLEEALRFGRVLQGLMPAEGEVHGLAALMELHASRTRARVKRDGTPVLLLDQDRGRWDHLLIRRGFAALARAQEVAPQAGPYQVQAAIVACHARARTAAETNWREIVRWYDQLLLLTPTPVVALNRAVALGMADGPGAGLAATDALRDDPILQRYHLLPTVRGEFLERLGRHDEARAEFRRAAELASSPREREVLVARAAGARE